MHTTAQLVLLEGITVLMVFLQGQRLGTRAMIITIDRTVMTTTMIDITIQTTTTTIITMMIIDTTMIDTIVMTRTMDETLVFESEDTLAEVSRVLLTSAVVDFLEQNTWMDMPELIEGTHVLILMDTVMIVTRVVTIRVIADHIIEVSVIEVRTTTSM